MKECGDSFGGFSELRQHVDTALVSSLRVASNVTIASDDDQFQAHK